MSQGRSFGSKSSTLNQCRQAVTPRLLWHALKDYDMWPIYLLGLTWTLPNQCATAYLTLTLKNLGFDTFETNLLTVPAYVLFITQLIFWTWVSEKINNRFLIILVCQIYMFPILIALETLPAGSAYAWSRYVLNMMLVGYVYVHAIIGKFLCLSLPYVCRTEQTSGHDESKRWISPHTYGSLSFVQYVRPDVQHNLIQCKPPPERLCRLTF